MPKEGHYHKSGLGGNLHWMAGSLPVVLLAFKRFDKGRIANVSIDLRPCSMHCAMFGSEAIRVSDRLERRWQAGPDACE
jgi:hypothetical protein